MKQSLNQISWLAQEGPQGDIALSTRLRLARNLEEYPFPSCGRAGSLSEVLTLVGAQLDGVEGMGYFPLLGASHLDLHLLAERHLISPAFVSSQLPRGLGLRDDGSLALMINEEDHLRLQCLLPGLQFEAAWQAAVSLEEYLGIRLKFAFDEEFGYLTACPSNVGTGLRASVMLHLPALAWLKALDSIVAQVAQLGLTVRGVFGEGSRSAGNLVQISNQITLGPSEQDILAKVRTLSEQLVTYERSARGQLMSQHGPALEDRVWRCLGVLRSARLMVSAEALEHLSMVRLGVDLGLLPPIPRAVLSGLMIRIRPANLQFEAGRELNPVERDTVRATLIRDTLSPYPTG